MKNNVEKMKIAYGWIYETERSLKSSIEYYLRHEYGVGWKSKLNYMNMSFIIDIKLLLFYS